MAEKFRTARLTLYQPREINDASNRQNRAARTIFDDTLKLLSS